MDSFFTIEKATVAEFKDRGSRFLAYAYPITTVEDFKKYMDALRKEHAKAAHHCFAYRIGVDGNNFRSSDAGEPNGTAGKPILGQIDSKQITNVALIVVRYFGGSLLGVPGLINAYKTVAALALQLTPVAEKVIEVKYNIHCNYGQINDVMTIAKQYNCTVLGQEMGLFCSIDLGIPTTRLELALHQLQDLYGVELQKIA